MSGIGMPKEVFFENQTGACYSLARLVSLEAIMLETKWQLQEAKSKLSELVEKALSQGPQIITKRGVDAVVVISAQDYRKLAQPKAHFVDVFLESPLRGVDLDLSRNKESGREIGL